MTIQIQKSSCYACDSNTGSWDVNHRRKTELWWPHVIWHYMGSPLTLTSIVKTGQANRWHHLLTYSCSERGMSHGGGGCHVGGGGVPCWRGWGTVIMPDMPHWMQTSTTRWLRGCVSSFNNRSLCPLTLHSGVEICPWSENEEESKKKVFEWIFILAKTKVRTFLQKQLRDNKFSFGVIRED